MGDRLIVVGLTVITAQLRFKGSERAQARIAAEQPLDLTDARSEGIEAVRSWAVAEVMHEQGDPGDPKELLEQISARWRHSLPGPGPLDHDDALLAVGDGVLAQRAQDRVGDVERADAVDESSVHGAGEDQVQVAVLPDRAHALEEPMIDDPALLLRELDEPVQRVQHRVP